MFSRSLKPKTERDKQIVSQLWKCDQIARKISAYSGLPFEDLRDVAREYLIKIYDSWDSSKANFSTWVNRCLNFYMLNYLRDRSRLIRIPRSYSDLYLKIKKLQKQNPNITETQVSQSLNVSVKKIRAALEAFNMRFSGSIESHQDFRNNYDYSEFESLQELLPTEYTQILYNISELPEQDENFLVDYFIKKRSTKTLIKNYPQLTSAQEIKDYSKSIIDNLLNGTQNSNKQHTVQ